MQALRQTRGPLGAAAGVLAGAGVFFSLPTDPAWGLVVIGLGLLVWPWVRVAGIGLLFAGLAFMTAAWQVARMDSPDYAAATRRSHWVVGQVVNLKDNAANPARVTLVLDAAEFYQLAGMGSVSKAHIGVNRRQVEDIQRGDFVAAQVLLLAPDGPERRNGYDGRLWRFFNSDTVYGYVQGALEKTYVPPMRQGWWERQQARLDTLRAKVLAASGGYAQGVVAALLVNSEGQVPHAVREDYRNSGLAHMLAVSGAQITLVAGGVFVALRWLMVLLWPGVALRINTKSWAGVAALMAAGAYTLLAGAGVTVVRAFIMAAVVIAAVVLGRVGSLLRIWCVAVVLMVLVEPSVVVRVGFQLSIAAVLALIVLSLVEERPRHWWKWLVELVLASLMAGAATAPILVAHFGQLPVLTVLANVVATLPMTLATYLSFGGLLLMPLGWQAVPWTAAALVADSVNGWAHMLAQVNGAQLVVESFWWPVVAVMAMALVGAVLARKWLWAVPAMALLASFALVPPPRAEVVIWHGGDTGWVWNKGGYRLAWAYKPEWALRGCERALGAPCSGGEGVAAAPDPHLLPVTSSETYAWAEKRGGHWHVEPLACGRVWQRVGC